MRSSFACAALLALIMGDGPMQAATLTIVPVTAYGKPIDGCTVTSVLGAQGSKAYTKDFAVHFQGLVGTDIPLGRYEVGISCPESRGWKSTGWKRVQLAQANQVEKVPRSESIVIAEAHVPTLTISLKGGVKRSEKWWVRMSGLYNAFDLMQRFERKKGAAGFWSFDPGSYAVTTESSAGYRCTRQIDIAEWTRAWAFDASTCTFDLDEFAHLVDESESKTEDSEWYDKIRRKQEDLRRLLEMRSPNQTR